MKLKNLMEMELASLLTNMNTFEPIYPDTNLTKQFKMVAQVIAAREELGFSRQTFFINFVGLDHHDAVLENQAAKLPQFSAAIGAFYETRDELNMSNIVMTFTISDFSRMLTSNGNGSDHGWGGNALVVGGSVNGAGIYGQYHELVLDHPLMLRRPNLLLSWLYGLG